MILTIYGTGLLAGYYLPRYGIEWMIVAMAATAFLAGYSLLETLELGLTLSPPPNSLHVNF